MRYEKGRRGRFPFLAKGCVNVKILKPWFLEKAPEPLESNETVHDRKVEKRPWRQVHFSGERVR